MTTESTPSNPTARVKKTSTKAASAAKKTTTKAATAAKATTTKAATTAKSTTSKAATTAKATTTKAAEAAGGRFSMPSFAQTTDHAGHHVAAPAAGALTEGEVRKVDKALQEVSSQNDALRDTYQKMLRAGGERFTVKPSGLPEMDELYEDLPNFSEVLDDIKRQLALCVDSKDRLELTPMLLLGDPGIGKTHFARRIAQLLGTGK